MKAEVRFVGHELRKACEKLKQGTGEDVELHNRVTKAIDVLEENPEAGIRVEKRLWPKFYKQRYNIDNLWKYNLGKGWRMIYTITKDEVRIISIILEWLDHKKYERRFKYG